MVIEGVASALRLLRRWPPSSRRMTCHLFLAQADQANCADDRPINPRPIANNNKIIMKESPLTGR
jgi:hypothetical protein